MVGSKDFNNIETIMKDAINEHERDRHDNTNFNLIKKGLNIYLEHCLVCAVIISFILIIVNYVFINFILSRTSPFPELPELMIEFNLILIYTSIFMGGFIWFCHDYYNAWKGDKQC